jgi:hypothetical protein
MSLEGSWDLDGRAAIIYTDGKGRQLRDFAATAYTPDTVSPTVETGEDSS